MMKGLDAGTSFSIHDMIEYFEFLSAIKNINQTIVDISSCETYMTEQMQNMILNGLYAASTYCNRGDAVNADMCLWTIYFNIYRGELLICKRLDIIGANVDDIGTLDNLPHAVRSVVMSCLG